MTNGVGDLGRVIFGESLLYINEPSAIPLLWNGLRLEVDDMIFISPFKASFDVI
jgi:hypothetical protein